MITTNAVGHLSWNSHINHFFGFVKYKFVDAERMIMNNYVIDDPETADQMI